MLSPGALLVTTIKHKAKERHFMASIYLFLGFIKHFLDKCCILLLELFIRFQKYEVKRYDCRSGFMNSRIHIVVITENNSSRDEKNSMIYLDRLKNKYTKYKGIKNNTNFGQITGIQEKMYTTCK
jgi:hypothetical protein